jgi:type IV pilus assembly protein PilV
MLRKAFIQPTERQVNSRKHKTTRAARSRDFYRGVTLIEVVVSMLVLLIGILGMLKLQAVSLKATYASFQRGLATVQAQDLVERLWAGVCTLSPTNQSDLTREAIVTEWQGQHDPTQSRKLALGVKSNLRMDGWEGTLKPLPGGVYEISISWRDAASGDNVSIKQFTSLPPCS